MTNEFEETALEGAREGETASDFQARLRLLERLTPALEEFSALAVKVSVDSPRTPQSVSQVRSDFTFQIQDIRIRMVLCPGRDVPVSDPDFMDRLSVFLLESVDTDAVAVVADNDDLSTWILDVYELNLHRGVLEEEGKPVRAAFREYLGSNLFAIDLPDFKTVVQLPTVEDLSRMLKTSVRNSFTQAVQRSARIPERKAALESLGEADLREVESLVVRALSKGRPPDLSPLMHGESPDS